MNPPTPQEETQENSTQEDSQEGSTTRTNTDDQLYYTGEADGVSEDYTGERDRDELDLQKEDEDAPSGGGARGFGPTYSTDA